MCTSSRVVVRVGLLLFMGLGATGLARGGGKSVEGVVNINEASAVELQLLSGVGPSKAEKIIEYRAKHRFRTVEELGRVKGIGPKTVRRLRLYLSVSGPTTARAGGGKTVAPAVPAPAAFAPAVPAPAPVVPAPGAGERRAPVLTPEGRAPAAGEPREPAGRPIDVDAGANSLGPARLG